jgi:hypothetical protein
MFLLNKWNYMAIDFNKTKQLKIYCSLYNENVQTLHTHYYCPNYDK